MAIFLTSESKVIVQGITGSEGTKHTRRMVASGTNVVGGVNALRGPVEALLFYLWIAYFRPEQWLWVHRRWPD